MRHSGVEDRGFMNSIFFSDHFSLVVENSCYRFEPPAGCAHADVLMESRRVQVQRGDYAIGEVHLADAIERLCARRRPSLSADRSPEDPG